MARERNDNVNLSWNHCLLSWALTKCPNPIALGQVRKSHTDTCPQTVGGGTVTVETLSGALMFPPFCRTNAIHEGQGVGIGSFQSQSSMTC